MLHSKMTRVIWSALLFHRYLISVLGSNDQSLQLATMTNGQAVCAVDEADQVLTSSDFTTSTDCIPSVVQCSWQCKRNPNCTEFNYRPDVEKCELYFNRPSCFLPQANCQHFQVQYIVFVEYFIYLFY